MTVRVRVLLIALGAAVLPVAALLWWTRSELTEASLRQKETELTRQARLAADAVGERPFSDSLADALGERSGLRVTLVGADGRVAGDSQVSEGRIAGLESHALRPEIRAALDGRVGADTRVSETVALPLLYVAVPHPQGAVRVALPQEEVWALADRAARVLVAVAAGTVVLLLLVAGPVHRFAIRPFRRLRRTAESVMEGDAARRLRETRGEAGELARMLNRFADRLERAGTQEERAGELEQLFDRMEDGIALVDRDGAVRRANAAFRDRVGRREVEGVRFETLFRDPDVSSALEDGLGGRAARREIEMGDRTVLVDMRPHASGAVAVLRDLTRLRRLEGIRRDFVANVSHELKTPLTSVLGFAEPLTDPDLPREQVTEFAERIVANGARMRRLVDDLLDLSRIEAGAWEPDREPVHLGDAARAAWREAGPPPAERDVTLELDVDPAPVVSADPDALRQILRNLLDNAHRYAPDASAVRVVARPDDGRVRIAVADEGPGVPEAHQERIFERFYRVDTGRSREAGGTGLGLSIVKHLVASHGGNVGIESRVGEGTTVWFTLPAASAA